MWSRKNFTQQNMNWVDWFNRYTEGYGVYGNSVLFCILSTAENTCDRLKEYQNFQYSDSFLRNRQQCDWQMKQALHGNCRKSSVLLTSSWRVIPRTPAWPSMQKFDPLKSFWLIGLYRIQGVNTDGKATHRRPCGLVITWLDLGRGFLVSRKGQILDDLLNNIRL